MTAYTSISLLGDKDDSYWDIAVFLVENRLFRVPLCPFIVGSPKIFGSLRRAGEHTAVAKLEGATISEFKTFLKLLVPPSVSSTHGELTKAEWLSILTLSTLWHFNDARKLAIHHLEPQVTDPIEMIQLGRAHYVPRWLLSGYAELVTRSKCVGRADARCIGSPTAIALNAVRHSLQSWDGTNPFPDFVDVQLRSKFPVEIHAIEERHLQHRTNEDFAREKEDELAKKKEAAERRKREFGVERRRSEAVRRRWSGLNVQANEVCQSVQVKSASTGEATIEPKPKVVIVKRSARGVRNLPLEEGCPRGPEQSNYPVGSASVNHFEKAKPNRTKQKKLRPSKICIKRVTFDLREEQ